MEWKGIGQKLLSFAPSIGGALLGPGGAAGGMAVKALAGAFGLTQEETTPERINRLINSDPEFALKAKIADSDFLVKMRELDIKELETRLEDINSARSREVEISKITGKKDINLYLLAWLGVIGYLGLIIYIIHWGLPEMSPEIALMVGNLIGVVGAKYSGIYDYFFGSSKGSADKNQALIPGGK